jgi:hypothetical protein
MPLVTFEERARELLLQGSKAPDAELSEKYNYMQ